MVLYDPLDQPLENGQLHFDIVDCARLIRCFDIQDVGPCNLSPNEPATPFWGRKTCLWKSQIIKHLHYFKSFVESAGKRLGTRLTK